METPLSTPMVRPKRDLRKIFFWILFIIFASLFYVIQFYSPSWIESLYTQNKIGLLNTICGVQGERSLGFYLGQAQTHCFGPLTQLISGFLLTFYALLYLQRSNLWKFFSVVFVYLLMTKLDVLFFPPYGDAIGGPFAETLWLAKHHFDYAGLLNQPGYAVGGPKVYVFTVYPTILAFLMTRCLN